MKKTLATFAIGLACVAFALQANAVPITGKIDFFGNLTTNNGGNLNTATAFTGFSGVVVVVNGALTPTGSYAGSGGPVSNVQAVTMTPFSFNPFPGGGVIPVWTFTSGFTGLTYSFDLTSISSVSQPGNNTLTVVGSGIAHITGFTDTFGTFFISTQGPTGPSFTFSATTTTPEGGSALALLGIGLVAIEVVRRKLATA